MASLSISSRLESLPQGKLRKREERDEMISPAVVRLVSSRAHHGRRKWKSEGKAPPRQTLVNRHFDSHAHFNQLATFSTARLVRSPSAIFACTGLLTGK